MAVPPSGMREIASSTGNSLPSARTAVISTRLPDHSRLTGRQISRHSLPVLFRRAGGMMVSASCLPTISFR